MIGALLPGHKQYDVFLSKTFKLANLDSCSSTWPKQNYLIVFSSNTWILSKSIVAIPFGHKHNFCNWQKRVCNWSLLCSPTQPNNNLVVFGKNINIYHFDELINVDRFDGKLRYCQNLIIVDALVSNFIIQYRRLILIILLIILSKLATTSQYTRELMLNYANDSHIRIPP